MTTNSIIQKSQLEGAHRLDAEYYQPEYLEAEAEVSKLENTVLCSLSEKITQGPNPVFINEGLNCLNGRNVKNNRVEVDNCNHISDEEFKKYNRFIIKQNDILITLKGLGSIGKTGFVFEDLDAIFSRDVGLIRLKNEETAKFIYAFLLSEYGIRQINRSISGGTGQLTLTTSSIKNIKVPSFSAKDTHEIAGLVGDSEKEHKNSLVFYSKAENLLLEELGLKQYEINDDLFSVVNFSDTQSPRRTDAEYFQPKYERLLAKVKSRSPKRLEDFVKTYSTGFPFKSENYQEEGIPLIRINNIKKGYLDLSDTAYLSEKDYLLAPKDAAKPGDIILSMSGTIGISTIIPKDVTKSSINQRILRISTKDIDKDYLVLLLNSLVGAYQLERIGTGGVQTNISYKDIKNILIPILSKPTQQKIADLVRRSHEARKKAKELLEEAKRKVEEMIEKAN